jgi:hypothetical protein
MSFRMRSALHCRLGRVLHSRLNGRAGSTAAYMYMSRRSPPTGCQRRMRPSRSNPARSAVLIDGSFQGSAYSWSRPSFNVANAQPRSARSAFSALRLPLAVDAIQYSVEARPGSPFCSRSPIDPIPRSVSSSAMTNE